jgi:uncharacterized protein
VTSGAGVPILIVPGIGNSGRQHWQTLWEQRHPEWRRLSQRDWEHPVCAEWVRALDTSLADYAAPPIIVAHSIGCLVLAHWASRSQRTVRGAFLVAVPDPMAPAFPSAARGFNPLPLVPFAFPSLIVTSADDTFGSLVHARQCADAWGSAFRDIGCAGHINAESGHGPWPEGLALFKHFVESATLASH